MPSSYVENIIDKNYDWWADDNFLRLELLEKTVKSWFSKEYYDFAALEKDPIVVAVIDSGINLEHSLFTGKYDDNGTAVDSDDIGAYDILLRDKEGNVVCKNTVDKSRKDYSPEYKVDDDSDNMHGTHVAGIIAALVHRLDLEKYIKIMPIKAGYPSKDSSGKKSTSFARSDLVNAVNFALENGADVVNMSLTSAKNDKNFDLVTENMAKQAIFVAAAGNSGWNSEIDGVSYPAAGEYCIGVMNYQKSTVGGASEPKLAASSNYGSRYDLCAPGTTIYSASTDTDSYRALNGTSMASPSVAFGSALALVKYRAIGAKVGRTKSVSEITELIKGAYNKSNMLETGASLLPVFDINMLAAGGDTAYAFIDTDAELTRYLGDESPVRFSLKILPSDMSGRGSVEWYVDNVKAGEGFTFDYVPKREIGDTHISAKWTYDADGETEMMMTSDIVLTVAFQPPTQEFVESMQLVFTGSGSHDIGTLRTGRTYSFTLSGAEQCADTVYDNMRWYVNGELVHAGKEMTFSKEVPGEYTITVKVGSYVTNAFTVVVSSEPSRIMRIILWASVGVGSTIVAFVLTVVIIVIAKRKKLR